VAAELERFLREAFQIPVDDEQFTRDVHLWEEGYVDSSGVVETIAFLEGRFGVQLPETVVFDPAFTHVDGIAGLVARLLVDAREAARQEEAS
jgi:D-alanine--poly(phosphoribitol) ligase subunit 2